jgi:hypothetical protein
MAVGRNYNPNHSQTLPILRRMLADFVDDDINWTSDPTPRENHAKENVYNCFGFVMDSRRWWQPPSIAGDPEGDPRYYWPKELTEPDSWVANYVEAARTQGFEACSDSTWEDGFERIVFLHKQGEFVHAALQISPDRWKSKLGLLSDFEHSLKTILMAYQGHRTTFMRRPARERTLK